MTWFPFEVYRDYWGTFSFDLTRGTLDLSVEDGNFIPLDLDGSGQFVVDATGRLVLTDLWLGTSPGGAGPAGCGHVFIR